jgi:5'-nucleotidase
MHILITNDDGVSAPGLLALAQAMRLFGQVSIVAPDHDWSGYSHTKHFKRPLRIEEVTLKDGTHAFAIDGSPADCVALAAMGLLNHPIDLVLAGINSAANVGYDLSYSGTVAAVKEAIIWRLPSMALSLDVQRKPNPNYELAATVASEVVQTVIDMNIPTDLALNINVPNIPNHLFKGLQITRTGHRVYRDRLEHRTDPRGSDYYWINGDVPIGIPQEGTDIGAIALGYASITPLKLDYTDYRKLPDLVDWGWLPAQTTPAQGIGLETAVPLAV